MNQREQREQRDRTMEIVRNGEKLVAEVQEMMARMDDFLRSHHIDPATVRDRLRLLGGEAAVREAEAAAQRMLQESREATERAMRDQAFAQAQSAGKRRMRTMV